MQIMLHKNYDRQLVIVDKPSNGTSEPDDNRLLKVHKHHHPIAKFVESKTEMITQRIVCKDGKSLLSNVFRHNSESWAAPPSIDINHIEK